MKGDPLLVGRPGVGKTSLGNPSARRSAQFVRIRPWRHARRAKFGPPAHLYRRLPGQIIQGLSAGTNISGDECWTKWTSSDAISAATILGADGSFSTRSKNKRVPRHYLDVPFDLSRVLFIATANWMDHPEPLRDRMEIIELPVHGEEKLHIAHKYLIPKQAKEHGLKVGEQIDFTDEGLREIIHSFTREAGVRQPGTRDRHDHAQTGAAHREDKTEKMVVTPEVVREFLGVPKFRTEKEVEERSKRPALPSGWCGHRWAATSSSSKPRACAAASSSP